MLKSKRIGDLIITVDEHGRVQPTSAIWLHHASGLPTRLPADTLITLLVSEHERLMRAEKRKLARFKKSVREAK